MRRTTPPTSRSGSSPTTRARRSRRGTLLGAKDARGWHIECSAMSTCHLGDTIDIHGGGRDLVFPHHENEIAQSEAATGEEFTRYWLHVGPLRVKDEKMSSSLGNFWTVHDALEEYDANEIRAFLVSTQYTKPQQFDDDALEEGAKRWARLENAYRACEEAMDSPEARAKKHDESLREATQEAREGFVGAMDDDVNTPGALAALFGLVDAVNAHVEEPPYDYVGLFEAWQAFEELAGGVLGFDFSRGDGDAGRVVEAVLALREDLREDGEYETADSVRDALERAGVRGSGHRRRSDIQTLNLAALTRRIDSPVSRQNDDDESDDDELGALERQKRERARDGSDRKDGGKERGAAGGASRTQRCQSRPCRTAARATHVSVGVAVDEHRYVYAYQKRGDGEQEAGSERLAEERVEVGEHTEARTERCVA